MTAATLPGWAVDNSFNATGTVVWDTLRLRTDVGNDPEAGFMITLDLRAMLVCGFNDS